MLSGSGASSRIYLVFSGLAFAALKRDGLYLFSLPAHPATGLRLSALLFELMAPGFGSGSGSDSDSGSWLWLQTATQAFSSTSRLCLPYRILAVLLNFTICLFVWLAASRRFIDRWLSSVSVIWLCSRICRETAWLDVHIVHQVRLATQGHSLAVCKRVSGFDSRCCFKLTLTHFLVRHHKFTF